MESLTVLVLLALASFRLTRLVVIDEILNGPRNAVLLWVREKLGTVGAYIDYLFSCTWCVGFWVSLAIYSVYKLTWPWDLGVDGWIIVFAISGGQGMLHALEPAE